MPSFPTLTFIQQGHYFQLSGDDYVLQLAPGLCLVGIHAGFILESGSWIFGGGFPQEDYSKFERAKSQVGLAELKQLALHWIYHLNIIDPHFGIEAGPHQMVKSRIGLAELK